MSELRILQRWIEDEAPSILASTFSATLVRSAIEADDPHFYLEVDSGKFSDLVVGFRPHIATVIDQLIRIRDFTLGGDLQTLLDQGLYSPDLTALFEQLWAARFMHAENRSAACFLDALLQQTFQNDAPALCSDRLLFWLTLWDQNNPAAGRVFLVLRGPLESDLGTFISLTEIWHQLGCPLRLLKLN